jgi:hypothetical protein
MRPNRPDHQSDIARWPPDRALWKWERSSTNLRGQGHSGKQEKLERDTGTDEKPGFELFGTLYDHPQGQRRYFMRQRLSQADEARKFGDAESVSTKPP